MKVFQRALITLLVITALPNVAQAYSTYSCVYRLPFYNIPIFTQIKWPSNNVTMHLDSTFEAGGSFTRGVETSIARWNNNPSKFRLNLAMGATNVRLSNNKNEIWFTADDIGGPAAEYRRVDPLCRKIESDIIFNNATNWTPSLNKSDIFVYGPGNGRSFQATMLHEMGHTVSLGHTANLYSIMGADFNFFTVNGSTLRPYIGEDAADGAVALYGRSSDVIEDISVTHWRRIGDDGEYSTHGRTRLLTTANVELPKAGGADPVYQVNNGQTLKAEFTFENSGETTQSFKLDFRVSTNNYISVADTLIETRTWSLTRDTPSTVATTVTLPNNLESGRTYWLGVRLDTDNEINEVDELNNRSWIAFSVN